MKCKVYAFPQARHFLWHCWKELELFKFNSDNNVKEDQPISTNPLRHPEALGEHSLHNIFSLLAYRMSKQQLWRDVQLHTSKYSRKKTIASEVYFVEMMETSLHRKQNNYISWSAYIAFVEMGATHLIRLKTKQYAPALSVRQS